MRDAVDDLIWDEAPKEPTAAVGVLDAPALVADALTLSDDVRVFCDDWRDAQQVDPALLVEHPEDLGGVTLALAVTMLTDAGAEVRSVCIYTKPGSVASPDFSWRETDRWIDFPWSARGTVVEEDAGVSPDEASA